jgi:hypothetical protein
VIPVVPLPGVGPQAARDALAAAHLACGNVRTAGGAGTDRVNAYRQWSVNTASALRYVLRPGDVDRLVLTPRHWALHALDPAAHLGAAGLVQLELDTAQDALADAVAGLDRLLARRSAHRGALVVADTNVYLHHPHPFERIDWSGLLPGLDHTGVHLLVPLVVVDELDRQKQGRSDRRVVRDKEETVRTRARITIRTLEDLLADPDAIATVSPEPSPVRAELLVDPPGHSGCPPPTRRSSTPPARRKTSTAHRSPSSPGIPAWSSGHAPPGSWRSGSPIRPTTSAARPGQDPRRRADEPPAGQRKRERPDDRRDLDGELRPVQREDEPVTSAPRAAGCARAGTPLGWVHRRGGRPARIAGAWRAWA